MTAATITPITPLKGHLADLLDRLATGTYLALPDDCVACATGIPDRCDTCGPIEEDYALIADAIGEIDLAADGDVALAVYMRTVMRLAGFPRTAEVRS